MSLIIFFRKSTDITLRIAALSLMLVNLRKGTAERREREMKFGCKFCQTTIVTLVIQGLPSSFLYRNPSCVSSPSLFEGQGGCTQCDTVEGFKPLSHISGYFFKTDIFPLRFPQNTRLHLVYSNRFPPSRQKR